MNRRFNVAVVGLGVMGRNHLRVLQSLEHTSISSLWDPSPGSVFLNDGRLAQSLEDVLNRRPDYVVVASPSVTHADVVIPCLRAGTPVLIEKPLATTLQRSLEILAEVRSTGIPAGVGHIERHNPAAVECHRRIQNGQIGAVLKISTVREGPYPERIQDTGVLLDLATHDLNLIEWIGQEPIVDLSGQLLSCSAIQREDFVVATGRTQRGAIVHLSANWMSPQKVRELVVHGERGLLRCGLLTQDLEFQENGRAEGLWGSLDNFRGVQQGDVVHYAFPRPEPLVMEHLAFQDLLSGGNSKTVTVEEGARAVMLAEHLQKHPAAPSVPSVQEILKSSTDFSLGIWDA